MWCGKRAAAAHTQTDGTGRYVFLDMPPGTYWLAINSNNMDPGAGLVPLYAWVCTERFVKDQPAKIYDAALSKTDLKINFPTAGLNFNNPYPMFSWDAYPEASYYTIVLDHITDAARPVENDTRADGLSFVPRVPLGIGKYRLRVYAWDAKKTRIALGEVSFAVQ